MLINTPAEIMRAALLDAELGSAVADNTVWPIYVGHIPDGDDDADNVICVYDTSGTTDGRIMKTGKTVEHPGIQVRVRGLTHPVAYQKIIAIQEHLDTIRLKQVEVAGNIYIIAAASRRGTIMPLGQESNKKRRDSFTVNAIVTVARVTP